MDDAIAHILVVGGTVAMVGAQVGSPPLRWDTAWVRKWVLRLCDATPHGLGGDGRGDGRGG